jgi:hypothetical protein
MAALESAASDGALRQCPAGRAYYAWGGTSWRVYLVSEVRPENGLALLGGAR